MTQDNPNCPAEDGPDFDHGAGRAVADGHLIINSGYGLYSHSPGNLLLVYSVDGR